MSSSQLTGIYDHIFFARKISNIYVILPLVQFHPNIENTTDQFVEQFLENSVYAIYDAIWNHELYPDECIKVNR